MANLSVSNQFGFIDKQRNRGLEIPDPYAEIGALTSISAIRTRLAALNPTYYTPGRLDIMTKNDLVYALRTDTEPGNGPIVVVPSLVRGVPTWALPGTVGAKGSTFTDIDGANASYNIITVPGATYENVRITGQLEINVDNITFNNCIFASDANAYYSVISSKNGHTFNNCSFTGPSKAAHLAVGENTLAYQCDFQGMLQDAIKITGATTIDRCTIRNHGAVAADAHADGIQFGGRLENITIKRTYIDAGMGPGHNSAITIAAGDTTTGAKDVTVELCYLNGGGWTMYGGQSGSLPTNINMLLNWNCFGQSHQYGYLAYWQGTATNNYVEGTLVDLPLS